MPSETEPQNNGHPEPVAVTDANGDGGTATIANRLERLEAGVAKLLDTLDAVRGLVTAKVVVKEWYTTNEVARILGRRPYTVREWCRLVQFQADSCVRGSRCSQP